MTELVKPSKDTDPASALRLLQSEFAQDPPQVIAGDNDKRDDVTRRGVLIDGSIQELTDSSAQAKKNAAEQWCRHATDYNRSIGRKPWKYLLISHDQVQENMNLEAFA